MSYTCGALNTDYIGMAYSQLGGSGAGVLMAGWIKPTTLTTGRGVVGSGSIFGAEINVTTSELLLRTDNTTTGGQWTTSGVGLTVGQWQFLAILNTCNNTGPTAAWRVWSGTLQSLPVECVVTQTVAPIGTFTNSTALTLGNKSGGTTAFQGEIGTWVFHRDFNTGVTSSFTISTAGAITDTEAQITFERYIAPIWKGDWVPFHMRNFFTTGSNTSALYAPLDYALPIKYDIVSSGSAPFSAVTLVGVTLSQERCPRAMTYGVGSQPMPRIRR